MAPIQTPSKWTPLELEGFVRDRAPQIAAGFLKAAHGARKEIDLVAEAEKVIERFAKSFGLDLSLTRERTLVDGFADAVYNRFVIEYEPPASLTVDNSSSRNKHAVQQVKTYIEGVADHDRHPKERLAGVAFDGAVFIFVRFRDGLWRVDDPIRVDEQSTRTFLRYLLSLSTELALTPENLVRDFGDGSGMARSCVSRLYEALKTTDSERVHVLSGQWLRQFQEVTGYGEDGGNSAGQTWPVCTG